MELSFNYNVLMDTHGSSGVRHTGSEVNCGSKCSKSRSVSNFGRYGGEICLLSNCSQLIALKNGCVQISGKPDVGWQPNLNGSEGNRPVIKSSQLKTRKLHRHDAYIKRIELIMLYHPVRLVKAIITACIDRCVWSSFPVHAHAIHCKG